MLRSCFSIRALPRTPLVPLPPPSIFMTDCIWSKPLSRTLRALGRPSAEAIRDLGERTGAPDLKRLTEDIVQSDRMGISIAESLRTLARESRVQRRQSAEELARKAPIKMVPVLIFCVLPALGIVTTAPAAILLMRTFSQSVGPR